jgi:hypothetical protein
MKSTQEERKKRIVYEETGNRVTSTEKNYRDHEQFILFPDRRDFGIKIRRALWNV